jgi:DNA-binding SARP family transcriptional activator
VESTRDDVRLHPSVSVDARQQVRAALDLLHDRTLSEQIEAAALLEGQLLPGWYEDWVVVQRETLRQLRLHALEAAAEQLAAEGRYGTAVELGLQALHMPLLRLL